MFKNVLLFVAGAIVASLLIGTAGLVFAQTQTPPTNQGSNPGFGMMGGFGMRGGFGGMHQYMLQAAAEALGVSEDEITSSLSSGKSLLQLAEEKGLTEEEFNTKMTAAMQTVLDQLVKDGTLTQAQADAMLDRMNTMVENGIFSQMPFNNQSGRPGYGMMGGAGMMGGFGKGGFGMRGGFGGMQQYMFQATAKVLGLSEDELNTALTSGKTIQTLVEEKGLTTDEFNTQMQAEMKTVLAKLVSDGTLTQTQADAMLANMATMAENGLCFGAGHGFGGRFWQGQPGLKLTPTATPGT